MARPAYLRTSAAIPGAIHTTLCFLTYPFPLAGSYHSRPRGTACRGGSCSGAGSGGAQGV